MIRVIRMISLPPTGFCLRLWLRPAAGGVQSGWALSEMCCFKAPGCSRAQRFFKGKYDLTTKSSLDGVWILRRTNAHGLSVSCIKEDLLQQRNAYRRVDLGSDTVTHRGRA